MPSIISAGTTAGSAIALTGDTTGNLAFQTNGTTTAMTIDTSQNVGIGTASPTKKLSINGDIRLGDGGGTGAIFTDATNGLRFMQPASGTSSTESMRIDSSGNVGVRSSGTTTPTYDFNTLGEGLWFRYWDSSGNRLADLVAIGNTPAGATQAMRFFTNSGGSPGTAVERMRLNAGTNILCLAGGSTTATGTGIAFPATQSASSNANTLDDYEEGTFTPLVSDGSNTASLGTCYYVKVGQLVHINVPAYAVNVSGLTAGNALSITGLPFTKNATFFAVIIANYGGTDKVVSCGDGSGTTFNLYVANNGQDYSAMTRNTYGGSNSISFRFSLSYRSDN